MYRNDYFESEQLAPMSRRLGAYIIDSIILGLISIGLIALIALPLFIYRSETVVYNEAIPYATSTSTISSSLGMGLAGILSAFTIGTLIIIIILFSAYNLFIALIMWGTNGFTPGKWLFKMRVVKTNGSKLTFLDAVLREVVIKSIGNSLLSGFLNVGSFIWACTTEDHKTAHDLVAQTKVILA